MNERQITHWPDCWREGGPEHHACAIAEAERQQGRAEAAERCSQELRATIAVLHQSTREFVREIEILHSRLRVTQQGEKRGWACAKAVEAQLDAATQRIETAEAWRSAAPWSLLDDVLGAAFHIAKNTYDGELWGKCERVEAWREENKIKTESREAIRPETGSAQP